MDGSVDFYRGWADYKRGFGNLNGEFWLGLDKIHRLTKTKNRLRVDLEETTGKTAYAEYDMFAVTSERTKYKLGLGTYSGKVLKLSSYPHQKKKFLDLFIAKTTHSIQPRYFYKFFKLLSSRNHPLYLVSQYS